MKKRILQFRKTVMAVMIGLLFGVAGKMYAYDFSAVCSTGQTLYYNIINATNHYVELTYPGSSMWDPWNGYTQPDGIIELPEYVSYEGTEYTITKIGSSAFSNCTGLSGNLVIPNSVITIDYKSFYNCVGFTGNLVLNNSLKSIGQEAFSCCSNLTGNLTIPNSVTTIGWKSFKECGNFSGMLTIGNSVEYIVSEAFYNCTGITSFSIPSSVIVIGENAFYGTGWYNNHSNGVLYQSNWCIGYKGDASGALTINTTTRGIASHAFYGKTFNKIYYNATNCMDVYEDNVPPFENCSGSLIIGNNVARIPPYMFQWAHFSGSIIIPNSVTTIGDYAFNGCNSVYSISLSEFIVSIGQKAFYNTGWYNNQSGVLYLNDWCIGYKGTPTGSLSIQEGTKGIADYAFHNCSGYNGNLTFPTSLVYIGNSAFYGCNFIGSLNIPNSVVSIGYSAFMFCSHFNGGLSIPQSIITIGRSAFYYCPGFISMTIFADNPPILGDFVFEYVDKTIPVQVPFGTISAYQAASGWSDFTNYQEIAYKSIPGYGTGNDKWAFIASPLATNTTPDAVGIENMITETTYDLYRFNQSATLEWENWKQTGDHYHFSLANGQGYLYANQEDVNLIFKGAFNEGTSQAVGLTYDGTAPLAGWNLVGNPFPYPATVSRSYYVMNEEGTGLEPTPLSAGSTIAACTGIMVKADGANESVTFAKPARKALENNGLLHIAVADTKVLDKAIVSFNAGDALEKYVFNKDNAKLYIPQGGKDYAIAVSDGKGEMPLNFEATKNGTYTLTVSSTINAQLSTLDYNYLHLIDNLTGNDIDLLQTLDYTFTAKTTDYASRFRLVFSICEDENDDNEAFAYVDNGEIIIAGLETQSIASLQVIDMTGRVIVCRNAARHISTNGMTPGVYVLRLINGENVKTQKIVVR